MPTVKVYDVNGKEAGDINLNEAVFGIEPHRQAMYDAVLMQRASMRQGTHKVKTRSEVRGGGKKPWRQKGTGRARQGTIRAPQWRGGGVVFGPTPRDYSYSINKKVYRLALKSALSTKVLDKTIVVVDELTFPEIKTKQVINVMDSLKVSGKTLIVTADTDLNVVLSARNLPKVATLNAQGVNVLDVLNYNNLIITKGAVAKLEEVLS